jgi:hypothetical protein
VLGGIGFVGADVTATSDWSISTNLTDTQEPETYAVSTALPEPSSVFICGLAAVGLSGRRKRASTLPNV